MYNAKKQKKRICVLCENEFDNTQDNLFKPLKYFDDRCLCNECLRKEKEGNWKKKN